MQDERFYWLATKSLSGELDSVERRELDELLKDRGFLEKYEWVKKYWDKQNGLPSRKLFDLQKGKRLTEEKIRAIEPGFHFDPEKAAPGLVTRSVLWPTLWKVAAAVAFFLGVGYLFYNASNIRRGKIIPKMAMRQTRTTAGQMSTITLSDGSKVVLNAESFLKYPSMFTDSIREVELTGEAYFEITKDIKKPFIVRTKNLDTRVLGTKFDIQAYPEEGATVVSLLEGKVNVTWTNAGEKSDFMLQPDQQVVYNKKNGQGKLSQFDPVLALGWKDNILQFDKTPLRDVLKTLHRRYGVQFKLSNQAINNCVIKAKFRDESIKAILEVIAYDANLRYKITNDQILLSGTGCAR